MYTYYDKVDVMDLSPTSHSIKLHILRYLYVTNQQLNLLNGFHLIWMILDTLRKQGTVEENDLEPQRIHIIYPPINKLILNCNCKKCESRHCILPAVFWTIR